MTAWTMTLSVNSRMRSSREKPLPTGQPATSSSVSRSMVATTRATRSPCRAGIIRLRSARCAGPSSAMMVRAPMSCWKMALFSAIGNVSGPPRATVRTSSGSQTTTVFPMGAMRSVNVSPNRRRIAGK
jgi:hypothetical protein